MTEEQQRADDMAAALRKLIEACEVVGNLTNTPPGKLLKGALRVLDFDQLIELTATSINCRDIK